MNVWNLVEYMFYLAIFQLHCKLSESAFVGFTDSTLSPTSSSVDILTTTERSVTNSSNNINGSMLKRTVEECNNSLSWICLKLEFVKLLERLTEQDEIILLKGISVVKDPEAKQIKTSELMAEIARSYPNDPDSRLNGFIINKIQSFLKTHYLRFKLIDDGANSLIETGRKDKFVKKGGLEALLAAGIVMKGTLMAIGLGGIALIAGKALLTALLALTMATAVGLKSLVSNAGKAHTYEIVTKPIYTSSHSHSVSHDDGIHGGHVGLSGSGYSGYGGYARQLNLNLPQSLKNSINTK